MFDQPPGNGVFVLFELSGHLKLTVVIWATASSSSFGKDVTEQVTTCSGVLQLIVVTLQQQSVSCSKRREKVSQRLIYLWAPYSKYKAGHSGGAHGETRRALERVAFTDTPDTIAKNHKVVRRYSRGKRECSSLCILFTTLLLYLGKKRTLSFPITFDLNKAPVRNSISRGLDGLHLHYYPSFVIFLLFLHHSLSLILLPSISCSNPSSLSFTSILFHPSAPLAVCEDVLHALEPLLLSKCVSRGQFVQLWDGHYCNSRFYGTRRRQHHRAGVCFLLKIKSVIPNVEKKIVSSFTFFKLEQKLDT